MLDICGTLESEDIVVRRIGKKQDFWHRPSGSITDSSQRRRNQQGYSDDSDDSEIVKKPVGNWRDLVDVVMRCQIVDLMVRDQSRPDPPADPGWVSCKPHRTPRLAHAAILISFSGTK